MAENLGKGARAAIEARRDGDPPPSDPLLSDPQVARTRIRQRWEFASALNFLSVFKPLIGGDLNISAEEIETALITPNNDLARLHVSLLKGIPPVNRKMTEADTWVTVVCKKLATWWPWVAEGVNPLNSDHGKEIQIYKALDPITRMLILKALCEVRALQDDVLSYVADELKHGTKLTTFRKERIGNVGNEVIYWYDGDPVIGHRLYKEVVQVEAKHKSKGKTRPTQPTINYQWETLATDLEEFQKISDNLSASNVHAEAAVGEIIKTEIVPVLAEFQKKKERALKRQQREVLQLNEFLNYSRVGTTRSCRERRPARYTFDEYDRSIDEAIEISKKLKTNESRNAKQARRVSHQKDAVDGNEEVDRGSSEPYEMHENLADDENNEFQEDNDEENDYNEKDEENKHQSDNDDDDDYNEKGEEDKQQSDNDEDDDYDEKDEDCGVSNIIEEEDDNNDDDDDNDDFSNSDADKDESPKLKQNHRDTKRKAGVGVRRSQRFVEPSKGLAETKKRLRQRPTRNSAQMVSDSEDSSQENGKAIEMVSDSEMEDSAASGDRSQEGSDDDGSQDSGDGSDE